MKAADVVVIATTNLARRKGRTLLTLMGVLIGVAALVLMVSLAIGLRMEVVKLFQSEDALRTLWVMRAKPGRATDKPLNALNFGLGGIPITDRDLEELRKLPGVALVTPDINLLLNMEIEGQTEEATPVPIGGLPPEEEQWILKFLTAGDVWHDPSERALLIPSRLLEVRFKKKPQEVIGKNAIFSRAFASEDDPQPRAEEVTYRIVGVIDTERLGIRAAQMYVPMQRALELREVTKGGNVPFLVYKKGMYVSAEVKAADVRSVPDVKRQLANSGYQVLTTQDVLGTINTVFLVIESFMAAIGAIGLIVSVFGIANTMAMAVLERTREIGIMKAIGARNSDIRRVFLLEAASIGLLGGLIGLPAGAAGGALLNFLAHKATPIPTEVQLFHVSPWLVVGTVAFSIIVSMVAGFMPALRASRLDPVQALRYE